MICRQCKKSKIHSAFRIFRVKTSNGSFQSYLSKTCKECLNAATRRKRATESGKAFVNRECRVCHKTKKIEEFRKSKTSTRKDGTKVQMFMWICKECERLGQKHKRAAQGYDYHKGPYLTQLLKLSWSSGQSQGP